MVKVRAMFGREWDLNVKEDDTILKMKVLIWLTTDVETTKDIRLIKDRHVLEDDHTLAHYEINEDTRISVVFKWSKWICVWGRICRGVLAQHAE